uniref:Tc1-like transposase DDE domain-containing protein n=1 Tax=Cyprinus carpio carpio TaxID=630221 RepID=A0A9J8BXK4_CYPCA
MEAQDASIAALSSSRVLGLASLNFLFTISHRFSMGFRSGELAGQLSTVIPWSVKSVMVWGAMSSAGVGPLCFLRSKVNAAVYQEVLEHFMLPAADQLYGDADFIFQQDLAPAHSAKATSTWFKDHGIPVLNWPANSPDLKPIENLWSIVNRKMRYARPKNAEELKATIRATWALITPEQCHRLLDSMPRRIAAVIQPKGAPTKY